MDIKIEKKKGWRALLQMKNIPYALGGVFLVFVVWLLLRDKASTLRVDADVVTVSEVEAGEFNDYVRLTGTVQPITTVQLSPLESGVVERIVAEEGSKVKKGDVIIEMSNNSLSMQILQSEADLAEKQNILRNTLISMEQERLSLRQEQLQLDIDVERKRRDYERKERLYKNELLSQEEWLQAKEDYELALNKRQLNVEKQRQDSLRNSSENGYDDDERSELGSISTKTEQALYNRKRAEQLARLLIAKKTLTDIVNDPDYDENWINFCKSETGSSVIRNALVAQKTKHIGSSLMELNVCGAIPPYNEILGGKLVALLATSPQVVHDYKTRYENKASEIASRLKGQPVCRPT